MPKPKETRPAEKPNSSPPEKPRAFTSESTSYLSGLYQEFQEQIQKYHSLTRDLLSLEARVDLAEKTMCLTRDHLEMTIKSTDCAMPHDWDSALKEVRFAGVRLADACIALLQEDHKLTPEKLLEKLNHGMYRFRTNSPLREIHASLIKQPSVERNGKYYVWEGTAEQQMPLRLRIVKKAPISDIPADIADVGGTRRG
jgi:hypothetical protein